MTFWDRYVFLCKSSGIEPCSEAAAKKIGVSTAAISGWNKKRIVPRGANLQKVADAFSVSVEYLLGTEPPQTTDLTAEESEWLDRFRSLTPEQRDAFWKLVGRNDA